MDVLGRDFPGGFEVVVPCLLDGDKMADALDCCAVGGRIVAYGCIGPCRDFDFFKLHRKRASIFSTEPRRDPGPPAAALGADGAGKTASALPPSPPPPRRGKRSDSAPRRSISLQGNSGGEPGGRTKMQQQEKRGERCTGHTQKKGAQETQ